MNFGVNQSWDQPGAQHALDIDLQHRIIPSPFAAKRLSASLSKLIQEYEQRYGKLGD